METLTLREQQVAQAVARGLTNREIAAELGISPETVKRHLATIFDKLGMHSRVMLALHVVRSQGTSKPNVVAPLTVPQSAVA